MLRISKYHMAIFNKIQIVIWSRIKSSSGKPHMKICSFKETSPKDLLELWWCRCIDKFYLFWVFVNITFSPIQKKSYIQLWRADLFQLPASANTGRGGNLFQIYVYICLYMPIYVYICLYMCRCDGSTGKHRIYLLHHTIGVQKEGRGSTILRPPPHLDISLFAPLPFRLAPPLLSFAVRPWVFPCNWAKKCITFSLLQHYVCMYKLRPGAYTGYWVGRGARDFFCVRSAQIFFSAPTQFLAPHSKTENR